MTDSALIDTFVTLVTTHWVRDESGEKVPIHEERREVRALVWNPMEVTHPDMCRLLALTIVDREAIAAS